MSTRQAADATVSAAEIATLIPDETARLHLAAVLGQVEACPWWAGQARSPGLNGQLCRRRESSVCRRMQSHLPIQGRMGVTRALRS